MTFEAWSRAIVAGVRRYLPDVRAVRKGSRLVIIRHADREAQLVDDGGAFCISFRAGDSAVTMSSLVDRDRRDSFTVSNLAHSILMRARNLVSLSRRNHSSYRDSAF